MMPFAPTIVYGVDSMPTELVVGDTTVILDGTVVTSNGTGWSYDSSINMLSITAEANFSEESGKGIYVDGDLNIEMDNVTIDLFTVEGGIPLTIHSGDVNLTFSSEIDFELFYESPVTVRITATDDGYSFSITQSSDVAVYVRITDAYNNETIINSDGLKIYIKSVANTGDDSNIALWSMCFIVGLGFVALGQKKRIK